MNHFQMIDAVNNATTEFERRRAQDMLEGWRLAATHFRQEWSCYAADMHTMEIHGEEAPMCAGVLLNWKPST